MLNSPSNPTGAVYNAAQLAALARVLVRPSRSVGDVGRRVRAYRLPRRVPHIFQIEPRLKQRGLVFNTLSKAYAMTGWRIGFAAGPREAIAAATRLQSQNSGNPNSIAQAAAVEALTDRRTKSPRWRPSSTRAATWWSSACGGFPASSLPNVPDGAFYAFVNVSAMLKREYKGAPIGDGNRLPDYPGRRAGRDRRRQRLRRAPPRAALRMRLAREAQPGLRPHRAPGARNHGLVRRVRNSPLGFGENAARFFRSS